MQPATRLTTFLAATIVGVGVLHLVIGEGVGRIRTGKLAAANLVQSGAVNAEIIISGSSRAEVQYVPNVLKRHTGLKAFNLGRSGAQAANIHTGVVRWYLNHNRIPKLLIANVDFGTLHPSHVLYDPVQYTHYLADDGLYKALSSRRPETWRARYVPLYGYIADDVESHHYTALRALFGIQGRELYKDGYLGLNPDKVWNPKPDQFRWVAKRAQFAPEAEAVGDFEELLTEAKSRGIPTIVVFAPMHRLYSEALQGREEIMAEYAAIAARQGGVFWDYSSYAPIANDTANFKDAHHLNRRGASAFSEVLGQRLAEWLRERR